MRTVVRAGASLTILSLFVLSCFTGSVIQYPGLTKSQREIIAQKIDASIDEADPNVNLGIKVVSTKTRELVYQRNAYHLFTPASNVKLFTAAAALHLLGPYYRFHTRMYTDATAVSDTLLGNLYVKGSGDPDFTVGDMEAMINDLEVLGIREIRGDIVVDNSLFDSDSLGPGWMWDEGSSWHLARVDAMTLNGNCVIVHVLPGREVNDPPIARLDPPTNYVTVEMNAVTVPRATKGKELIAERRWKTRQNVIDITGEIVMGAGSRTFEISIENPWLYAGLILKERLTKNGIHFKGVVRRDTLPPSAGMLSDHISKPLSEIVKNFLKISNNLTAELLVKTIGADRDSATGTWANGLRTIKTFLSDEVGIDTSALSLADGSGISRYNLVAPDQIVQLLLWAHENFHIYPEFTSALPIAGADGTLKTRMVSVNLHRKSRAKTGTLRGVSSLSGYVLTADNETLAFSLMMTGYVGDSSPYRTLQDRIVSILAAFSRF